MVHLISFVSSLAILSSFFPTTSQNIELKCMVKNQDFVILNRVSICKVNNSVEINAEDQVAQLTNQYVETTEGVVIENQNISYLPHFINDSLKNFRVLVVRDSKLKKISSNPLRNLKSLEYLDVSRNEIEYIPGKLFEFNPVIKVAIFDENKIKAIDTNAFGTLQHLELNNLTCYSGTAKNKGEITKMIEEFNKKCSGELLDAKIMQMKTESDHLKTSTENYDQLLDDVRTIKILTSLIFTFLLLAALLFLLHQFHTKITQIFSIIQERFRRYQDDNEIIIEDTSSINYASCSHINGGFTEATNSMENSAVYDTVNAESTVVEDEKARVVGIKNISPNSTNYANVVEILTHLDQKLAKVDSQPSECQSVLEKSRKFEEKSNVDSTERKLQKQQSHKIGSQSTNAIFDHESLSHVYVDKNSQNINQKLNNSDQIQSNSTQSSSTPPNSEATSSNVEQKSLTRQDSNTTPNTDQKLHKSGYKTKIPQSMVPKTLNLANIDEKISSFGQTSPVFADVAQKLMSSSAGSHKPANHFGFRSLTYADVAQKFTGQGESSKKSSLSRQNSTIDDQKSPNVKDLAKKFAGIENFDQKPPMTSSNPFLEYSTPSDEQAEYAEPIFRTSAEANEQNVGEYAEPYQSQKI